jgi:hypothetical protein
LRHELGWKQECLTQEEDWVRLCGVFPFFEGNARDDLAFSRLARKMTRESDRRVDFLYASHLRDPGFASTVEDMLDIVSLSSPTEPQQRKISTLEYLKGATWCLLHSVGVILHHRSRLMDEELARHCRDGPSDNARQGSSEQTELALLSAEQMYILTNKPPTRKLVIILGRAGTGKTFLLLAKIKRLDELRLLHKQSKAIVLVHGKNIGLYWQLKRRLWYLRQKVLVHPYHGSFEDLKGYVALSMKRGYKYVFVDQLEDFLPSFRGDPEREELFFIEELEGLYQILKEKARLVWLFWNGKDDEQDWDDSGRLRFLNDVHDIQSRKEPAEDQNNLARGWCMDFCTLPVFLAELKKLS